MIELVLDFVSLNAYLALGPAKRLAEDLDVELKLTPLRSESDLSFLSQPSSADDLGQRHRRIRADYAQADVLRYAVVQGLNIQIDGRNHDSTVALKGLLAANAEGRGFDYAGVVFAQFWAGELEIDSNDAIARVLEDFEIADFDATDSRWDLESVKAQMDEREIYSVPTFDVEGERYLGRQHLPMIRWQLEGYQGPGPI